MKHYFYFEKGQPVPQWLMRQRNSDNMGVASLATFKSNGKVMVDSETGDAFIWPSSKRFTYLLGLKGSKNITIDVEDTRLFNHMYMYSPRRTKHTYSLRNGDKRTSPLVAMRSAGFAIRTSTKCLPIPETFQR